MLKVNHDAVKGIIREVAHTEIMPRFHHLKKGDIDYKIGDDPVTIADKEAEKALSTRLSALLVGSKVVGEEDYFTNNGVLDLFSSESLVWVIDPVDGTRNFVAGKPTFGVIVALVERNHTVAGWLYDPNSDEFISAEKGCGAYHNDVKLSVLPAKPIENMVGTLGLTIHKAFERLNLPENTKKPRVEETLVCCCHEYARLVAGPSHFSRKYGQIHFRCWLDNCTPWDCAAGTLIHSESGGYSAHWNGDMFTPSSFGRGTMDTPDVDSWHKMRDWIAGFCDIPLLVGKLHPM